MFLLQSCFTSLSVQYTCTVRKQHAVSNSTSSERTEIKTYHKYNTKKSLKWQKRKDKDRTYFKVWSSQDRLVDSCSHSKYFAVASSCHISSTIYPLGLAPLPRSNACELHHASWTAKYQQKLIIQIKKYNDIYQSRPSSRLVLTE